MPRLQLFLFSHGYPEDDIARKMNRREYIKVIIPVKFPGTVTYALPEGTGAKTGQWVSVRFGNKEHMGVIAETGIEADITENRIKEIDALEQFPEVTMTEIELWKQMAEYYMCTIGEVFKSAYPLRKVAREEKRISSQEKSEIRTQRLAATIEEKLAKEFSRIEERISRELAKPSAAKRGYTEALLRHEMFCKSRVLRRFIDNSPGNGNSGDDSPGNGSIGKSGMSIRIKKYTPEDIRALSLVMAGNMKPAGNSPDEKHDGWEAAPPALSPAQKKAEEEILDNFRQGKRVLLKGVAGSGKTEIYADISARIIGEGKSVLMLVPEISLSRQLEDRMKSFFGNKTLVYHSKETPAKRDAVSERLRKGEPLFILGTRSALLLPHGNLGLIIVDEENDSSYKQEEPAPRYNGRDTAIMLSAIAKVPLLLGSATPSYETLYNVMTGKLAEVALDEKYHKGSTVRTVIIDTIAERRKRGMNGSISKKLAGLMQDTLNRGGQIMVLRSRRSYSPVLQCRECGEMPKCPHCNAYLSYHKEDGCLECHYCGSRFGFTGVCDKCGGTLEGKGAGTEKIEEEIRNMFPLGKTARLDSDTARNPAREKEILDSFSKGDTDILIGTQIIAKGFDFGNVSLVAVLNADSLIGLQDFRADENALQLLSQLRGRWARRKQNGLFVIQTEQPDHPVYRRLMLHESPEEGLKERQTFGYPPFTRMVEIVLRSSDENHLMEKAHELHGALEKIWPAGTGMPVRPATGKIAGKHICIIRVRFKRDRNLAANKRILEKTVNAVLGKNGKIGFYFNPDPL